MRIPAVAIAVAFAGGILLGREMHPSHRVLEFSFLLIISVLIVALLFAWRNKLGAAAILSLMGWVCLGAVALVVASLPLPPEPVLCRIAVRQIGLQTPLRCDVPLRT